LAAWRRLRLPRPDVGSPMVHQGPCGAATANTLCQDSSANVYSCTEEAASAVKKHHPSAIYTVVGGDG